MAWNKPYLLKQMVIINRDMKIENTNNYLIEAIDAKDIAHVRDAICQGADVTIHGNYAMECAIREKNINLAQILLEERFNILKDSNPILTLLSVLLTDNEKLIEEMKENFKCPKTILYALHHCTPKTATAQVNKSLIEKIMVHTSLTTLNNAKKEVQGILRRSMTKRPRHEVALTILNENILQKRKHQIIEKLSPNNLKSAKTIEI
jgi:hypothetical protein